MHAYSIQYTHKPICEHKINTNTHTYPHVIKCDYTTLHYIYIYLRSSYHNKIHLHTSTIRTQTCVYIHISIYTMLHPSRSDARKNVFFLLWTNAIYCTLTCMTQSNHHMHTHTHSHTPSLYETCGRARSSTSRMFVAPTVGVRRGSLFARRSQHTHGDGAPKSTGLCAVWHECEQ